jgi:hypothetical protein
MVVGLGRADMMSCGSSRSLLTALASSTVFDFTAIWKLVYCTRYYGRYYGHDDSRSDSHFELVILCLHVLGADLVFYQRLWRHLGHVLHIWPMKNAPYYFQEKVARNVLEI